LLHKQSEDVIHAKAGIQACSRRFWTTASEGVTERYCFFSFSNINKTEFSPMPRTTSVHTANPRGRSYHSNGWGCEFQQQFGG